MKSIALIVLVVLQVSVLTRAAKECCTGKNEVFNRCGTHCETDCANPGSLRCIKSCKAGCFCKEGYTREKKYGVCIKKEKCPNTCDEETEEFTLGVKACQNVCGTGLDPACAYTTYMPMTDCFCKEGYVRESIDGRCIPVEDCPETECTIENEEFKCGVKRCQYVCGVGIDEFCSRARFMCKDGCFCKDGFVRDVTGQCIPNAECPALNVITQETTM